MYRGVMAVCDVWSTANSFYPKENEDVERLKNWLKSLKTRITWKPSDEQMEALEEITNSCYLVGSKYKPYMNSLYQELKKLREE